MARDIESLVLQMSADVRRFEKSMDRMSAVAQKRLTQVEAQALKSQKNLERIMSRAGEGMVSGMRSALGALAPTLATAFSTAQVIKYADSYTGLQNQLRATGLAGSDLRRVEDRLYETANRNGVAIDATAQLYARASLARKSLGASEQQLMALVSGTTAALRVQGVSSEQASGPLLQLGQALGSGSIQAEEFNSLIDGLPVLLQAAANGSTKFGGDIGKLRAAVKDGEVTSREFFDMLLKGFPELEKTAAGASQTVGQALQTLNNQLGRYVGQTDSSLSATARMAQGIELLANNLDKVMPVVATLAAVVGGRYAIAMTTAAIQTGVATVNSIAYQAALIRLQARQTGATGAQIALNAAMSANPIGLVITVVAALAAGLYLLASRYNTTAIAARELDNVVNAADGALDDYREAVDKAKNASAGERVELEKKAAALRQVTLARINDAKVAAQKQIDEAVAARRRADQSIGDSAAARSRSLANPNNSTAALASGASSQARANISLAVRAREEADTAIQAYERLKSAMDEIESPKANGGGGGGGSAGSAGRGSSGPTPQDLAAQREMLDLEARLELLRAQGRTKAAEALSDQIDTIKLTKTYQDAGFDNAQTKAVAQVQALREAANTAEFIAKFEQDQADFIERATTERERQADLAMDELSLRAEIARLMGDETGYQAAQREYDITRRIADLRAKGMGEDDARTKATRETDQLRGAEIVGGLGSGFQNPLEQMREQYAEIDRLRQEDVLSEQEAAAAKAQANALYQEQRLSSASSFFGTLAELQDSSNKELAAIGKAAAIAQATMDGYVAVQKALASAPPPFNYALAAAVGVVAAANVAKIAGMADGGPVRGVGGDRQDNQLRWLSVNEYVVNAKAAKKNRRLLDAINYGGAIPGLADGGVAGVPRIPDLLGMSAGRSSSLTYSPSIDARGADLAAVARLERVMAEERRQLPKVIMGVVGRKAKYRLGKNAEA